MSTVAASIVAIPVAILTVIALVALALATPFVISWRAARSRRPDVILRRLNADR